MKDKQIDDIIGTKVARSRESYFKNNHIDVYNDILDFTSHIDNIPFKERLWYYYNDNQVENLCECGNRTTFNKKWKDGYRPYCSTKCSATAKSTKEKRKQTNLEKYGVDNVAKNEDIKRKQQETNLRKYGHRSSFQNEEVKEKWRQNVREKYGVDHIFQLDEVKEKSKKTSLERYGKEHYAQTDEYIEKAIETNREKYGKDWFTQTDEYIEKVIETNREKYDKDWFIQTDEYKEKTKNTNLEKYRTKHYYQSEDFREKSKETNLKRYGTDNPMENDEILEKIRKGNIEKYGVEHYYQSEDFKEKSKKTNLENFGVDNPFKSKEIRDRIRQTNNDRFGSDIFQNEEYRKKYYKIAQDLNYIKYLENNISLFKCDCNEDHSFEIHIDNYIHRSKLNVPLCTICYPISDQKSIKEKELFKFIESIYQGEIISGYRDGLEIDIYLPELNLGFEFNGLYWHSEIYRDKNYHLNKTEYFHEKDIRIIHIWEDEWDFRKDIVKSQIKNWLDLTDNRIYARKCEVREIKESNIVSKFLNDNHIQGKTGSSLKLGLYYKEELVSVMTFDHRKGRISEDDTFWNLNRFCNLINYNVIGGFGKLFKYFLNNFNIKTIISYADRDWSEGDIYKKFGFKLDSVNKPDYKYIIEGKRMHKSGFKKSDLGIQGKNITEREYMNSLNIHRIYDCGKLKFIYHNH